MRALSAELDWWFRTLRSHSSLRRVRKREVLIYDRESLGSLGDLLHGVNYGVMETRGQFTHLNPRTVFLRLRYLVSLRSPSRAYFAAVIRQVAPSVVLTTIDNDLHFHILAGHFPGVQFVAVQNGWRFPSSDSPLPPGSSFRSILLSFGQNDVDHYQKLGIEFRRIQPVGSLRNALWVKGSVGREEGQLPVTYDLCVISEYQSDLPPDASYTREIAAFLSAIGEYATGRPELRLCVALRSSSDINPVESRREREFFAKLFNGRADMIDRSASPFNTYDLIDRSRVNASSFSSASLEALGRGRRTLIFSRIPEVRPPHLFPEGTGSGEGMSRARFMSWLDWLLIADEAEVAQVLDPAANYYISSGDERRADEVVVEALRGGLFDLSR